MTLTTSEASKMFQVFPRSKKALTVWEMANIKYGIPFNVKMMARAIAWSLSTGRLIGTAEMAIRGMSTYRQLKLLVEVVNNCRVQNDVPKFLNGYFGE